MFSFDRILPLMAFLNRFQAGTETVLGIFKNLRDVFTQR